MGVESSGPPGAYVCGWLLTGETTACTETSGINEKQLFFERTSTWADDDGQRIQVRQRAPTGKDVGTKSEKKKQKKSSETRPHTLVFNLVC